MFNFYWLNLFYFVGPLPHRQLFFYSQNIQGTKGDPVKVKLIWISHSKMCTLYFCFKRSWESSFEKTKSSRKIYSHQRNNEVPNPEFCETILMINIVHSVSFVEKSELHVLQPTEKYFSWIKVKPMNCSMKVSVRIDKNTPQKIGKINPQSPNNPSFLVFDVSR